MIMKLTFKGLARSVETVATRRLNPDYSIAMPNSVFLLLDYVRLLSLSIFQLHP